MAKKQMAWKTKGMNRDLSVSAFNPEFAFENRNLRLSTSESNTMMSWVNERGTELLSLKNVEYWSKRLPNYDYDLITYKNPHDSAWTHHSAGTEDVTIIGTPIGTAVINHKIVIFTTDTLHDHDYIYVLKYIDSSKQSMSCKMLFGNEHLSLNFSIDYPLETLVSYESEVIQKVYWTDGRNQPRVINIEGNIRKNNNTQFDFVPTLQLQENVSIKKMLGANGMFAPGVIQYAFTYYTKYGQESNIFYVSPLLYISYRDRGASPEDKVENAFRITVKRVDANFDYLRIYSIQRTSIDATPICKRIQDIAIEGLDETEEDGLKASYTDTGTTGDSVDPTELLYKGGEVISAMTMNQKDGTLFLGNLEITRPQISKSLKDDIKNHTDINQSTRSIQATSVSTGSYVYANQLTAYDAKNPDNSVPCAGFKYGDTYRLGVQFQYKTGQWSEPVWIDDKSIENRPGLSQDNIEITLPTLTGVLKDSEVTTLVNEGYMKARSLVVFPKIQDRTVMCQGVVNPTMWTQEHHNNGDLYAQSSWFFRASNGGRVNSDGSISPISEDTLKYTFANIEQNVPISGKGPYTPYEGSNDYIRQVEIQGQYNEPNKFKVHKGCVTFHSPEIEFDTQSWLTDYSLSKFRQVGKASFVGTLSDIDIQTETPTASSRGSGFLHKSFTEQNTLGVVSGLFYDDFPVDDDDVEGQYEHPIIRDYRWERSSCKWMVYLWHRTGSLNNDVQRPAGTGVQSAVLKKKMISNLRYANTAYDDTYLEKTFSKYPRIFSSNEPEIIKMDDEIYMGNIDTALVPDTVDGDYFCFNAAGLIGWENIDTPFTSNWWWKTFNRNPGEENFAGFYKYNNTSHKWEIVHTDIGKDFLDIVEKKNPVRMKYKSTPHLVFEQTANINWGGVSSDDYSLPIIEILNPDDTMRFGGESMDALRENIWVPAGEPVPLTTGSDIEFKWDYGDTYFQRWDCLKTYAFTHEDPNQVVEIGSFMLETHVNIDGRYDRNRGQRNNLNMSPQNFNLLNPIYSQINNFFQYRILDSSVYENTIFPNQVTWSKTKESGADVDLWTNMTLASVLEMDGDKGEVTSLQKMNNQLVCFQNSGVSRISYNENFQVTTTEGVPVEIANSGKVQGKSYISGTIGCSNKWSIAIGNNGLYFMDSDGKDIYLFNGQLNNLSTALGFNSWSKLHIPANDLKWTPIFPLVNEKSAFISHYDRKNQEILFINHNFCLAYSEKFGVFTSFYDYDNTPYFCNLDDTGIWVKANTLWKHQTGRYCDFFGAVKPYSMILIGNPEPTMDKIFTNVEFRACVDGDGTESSSRFTPYLPFDSLDTWNEYQHGMAYLSNMRGHRAMLHHTDDNEASIKRKFRIWACDIPRDNGENVDTFDETFDDTFHPLARTRKHPTDRMRNPWLYLRFRKGADSSPKRVEIHDMVMTYFD